MVISPVIFELFGLKVYWYGLFYVLGFLFTWFFVVKFSKSFGFEKEKAEDILFWTMVFGVIGGRLGEVIFYNPSYYFSNFFEIFRLDRGGMSIHGGFVGAGLTLLYFSRKEKVSFFKLSDMFVIPASLALTFGRLANFINQELVGRVTSSSLGVVFPLYDDKLRWPSTIFASVKNMLVFQVLFYMFYFRKLKSGVLTAWFFILYNFGRFFVDFFREPEVVVFASFGLGQILSLFFGFFGVVLLFVVLKK